MKDNSSRRFFLRNAAIASTGIAFFSTSIIKDCTAEISPFRSDHSFLAEKNDIRITGSGGKHITVRGIVYDRTGVFSKANVIIEIWHLSPGSSEFGHQAKLITNSAGEYSFITDHPARELGKVPRIYFKVTSDNGSYETELIIADFDVHISDKHWELNQQLGNKLFPQKQTLNNQSEVIFNLSV